MGRIWRDFGAVLAPNSGCVPFPTQIPLVDLSCKSAKAPDDVIGSHFMVPTCLPKEKTVPAKTRPHTLKKIPLTDELAETSPKGPQT
eukprot:1149143-Pelagomonas_calceolata.AAC.2